MKEARMKMLALVGMTCVLSAFAGRGKIMDRYGTVLVSSNPVILSDSTSVIAVRNHHEKTALQLIGYVDKATQADVDRGDGTVVGDTIGKAGVEKYYDNVLRGGNGVPGKDIQLTIDSKLQKYCEELMEGKEGSVVAIEPSTGEILCMVSSPTYNPRHHSSNGKFCPYRPSEQDRRKDMYNRCVSGQYYPGSVFAAAQGLVLVSEGVISTETSYPCKRGFMDKGIRIACHVHTSPITLTGALATACNSYFCHGFLEMMDNPRYGTAKKALETWRDQILSLGFGHQLGIDLPNEMQGHVPDGDYYDKAYEGQWSSLTALGNAVGQGATVATPLQLANLSAVIANRGFYYIPHVVKDIQGGEMDSKYQIAQSTKISRDVFDTIADGMRASRRRRSSSALSRIPVKACGISGSATSMGHEHSVFIGFAPADNPRIAVAVYVENGGKRSKNGVSVGGLVMEKYLNGELSASSNRN